MYTPFDINEAISHRKDYVEERLRGGSPIVGLRYADGLLLLTVRRSQRKVFEIYDRQMFSGIGKQSDIENVRLRAIQDMHQEGFERSPDDVSVQRLVGFTLSPVLKKAFGDPMYEPIVLRALFAELGRNKNGDTFYTLNYDGEMQSSKDVGVVAGTQTAEDAMLERLGEIDETLTRDEALRRALSAWAVGARELLRRHSSTAKNDDAEDDYNPLRELDAEEADRVFLRDELKTGAVEVGLLERRANRDGRFRLLGSADIDNLVRDYI